MKKSCFALVFIAALASGQHQVPFQNGIPVAPTGLESRPLPDKPVVYDTAEGMKIRVVPYAVGLEYPFGMAFLPDGNILVTERTGHLRIIRKGALDPKPVAGTPTAYWFGEPGLPGTVHGYMDVVLHPKFADNHYLYLTYTKPIDDKKRTVALARGKWDGNAVTEMRDIFVPNIAATSRIAFGADGMLYMSMTGNDPQDPNTLGGKVLRLKDDGTVPPNNPFAGKAGARPEVYTLGHRGTLGLALHPGTGQMWQNENGPNGGDEINVLKPGANYGWPIVSFGRDYPGPWHNNELPGHQGFEYPVVYWTPAIAVSGMTFYTGNKLPKWKGDVFVGSLREGEIPGTGHLERILFNEKMQELRREALLRDLRQRIRDVRMGPDELLYVLTDSKPGAVLRIEPAQ
jgi:glucose/arabinose dehydrogenase